MRKLFIVLNMIFVIAVRAQYAPLPAGVNFEHKLSWEQILEKAKNENKYIFVDVYATWCAPCKKMEQLVYTSNEVAQYENKYFVSVKLQIDTTKNDD